MKGIGNIAFSLWHVLDQRDQLLIVTLHRVGGPQGLSVTTVEKSLRYLANRYRFVLPSELQDRKVGGKMAMLTIDDGHMDAYSIIYPIVKSLNISMVVCITTDFFFGKRWLWFDKLRWVLDQPDTALRIKTFSFPEDITVNKVGISQHFKSLFPGPRDELLEKLAQHCGLNIPLVAETGFCSISDTEVNDMLKSGVMEIASHTVTHPILTHLSDEDLEFELQHSKEELENFSGQTIHAFCYPNGQLGDYDERTQLAVKRAGYKMAFTSIEGLNYKKHLDWGQLKRVHIHREDYIFRRSTSGVIEIPKKICGYMKVRNRISVHGQGDQACSVRRFPYPYRAMLAICSDLDGTPDGQNYFSMMKYLNTFENTEFGPGVGLEIGNTIYFDVAPPQFCYWNTSETGRAMVRRLIRSGHIDCLHSFGTRAITRADAARALGELERHNCHIKVWVDHAKVPTNFGSDVTAGSGDLIGEPAYHADLATDYGIQYIWRGRVSSIIGQDIRRDFHGIVCGRHPLASCKTVSKEFVKGFSFFPRFTMNRNNNLLREIQMRSGHCVWEFMRFNSHWGGVDSGATADGFPEVLTERTLDYLIKREGCSVLYTHLGRAIDPQYPFSSSVKEAFTMLSEYAYDGKILVTTTRRLLDYRAALSKIKVSTSRFNEITRIDISKGGADMVLDGLTIYVSDSSRVEFFVDGCKVDDFMKNPPDKTGRPSISLPWRKLEFPLLEQVSHGR